MSAWFLPRLKLLLQLPSCYRSKCGLFKQRARAFLDTASFPSGRRRDLSRGKQTLPAALPTCFARQRVTFCFRAKYLVILFSAREEASEVPLCLKINIHSAAFVDFAQGIGGGSLGLDAEEKCHARKHTLGLWPQLCWSLLPAVQTPWLLQSPFALQILSLRQTPCQLLKTFQVLLLSGRAVKRSPVAIHSLCTTKQQSVYSRDHPTHQPASRNWVFAGNV